MPEEDENKTIDIDTSGPVSKLELPDRKNKRRGQNI